MQKGETRAGKQIYFPSGTTQRNVEKKTPVS